MKKALKISISILITAILLISYSSNLKFNISKSNYENRVDVLSSTNTLLNTTTASKISYVEDNYILYVGDTINTKYYTLPYDVAVSPSYISANDNIATIDSNGVIKGIACGATTITIKVSDDLYDTANVLVLDSSIDEYSISSSSEDCTTSEYITLSSSKLASFKQTETNTLYNKYINLLLDGSLDEENPLTYAIELSNLNIKNDENKNVLTVKTLGYAKLYIILDGDNYILGQNNCAFQIINGGNTTSSVDITFISKNETSSFEFGCYDALNYTSDSAFIGTNETSSFSLDTNTQLESNNIKATSIEDLYTKTKELFKSNTSDTETSVKFSLLKLDNVSLTIDNKDNILSSDTYVGVQKDLNVKLSTGITLDSANYTAYSSDEDVVSVDNGTIVPKSKGSAVITVYYNYQNKLYDTISIDVKKGIEEISILNEETYIELNETLKLNINITPNDADNTDVTYETSNENVATVSADGLITTIGVGEFNVVVKSVNTSANATKTFTVKRMVKSISLDDDKLPENNTITKGLDTLNLNSLVIFNPSDATNKELTYELSDDTKASIINGILTPLSSGNVSVKIISLDNTEVFTTLDLTIYSKVESIELDSSSLPTNNIIIRGEDFNLSELIKFTPIDASNKSILYESSDESIATISNDGIISGIKSGTVEIRATSEDNSAATLTETFEIYVKATSIAIDKIDNTTKNVGSTYQISARVLPLDANNTTITYTSSDQIKATVSSTGLVTFLSPRNDNGEVNIKLSCENGTITNTITFKIIIPVEQIVIETLSSNVLPVGESISLNVGITPFNATNKKLTYETSNSCATVSQEGVVTGVSNGEVRIIVKSDDGNYETYVDIFIGAHVDSVSILNDEKTILVGEELKLEVEVLPEDAANKNYTIEITNGSYATLIDENTIKAISVGRIIIIVRTIDQAKTYNYAINIKQEQSSPKDISESNVSVSTTEIIILKPLINAEYRIISSNGSYSTDWVYNSNQITFSDLKDNTEYYIEYRMRETEVLVASESKMFSVKTLKKNYTKIPTVAIVFIVLGGVSVIVVTVVFMIKFSKRKD